MNSKTVTSSPGYKILVGLAAKRLYNIAQGFSPGLRGAQFALKVAPRRVLRCVCVLIPPPPQHRVPLFLLRPIFPELPRTGRAPFYESRDPGLKPISANLAEALRNWVGFLSRRDFTIVARQFIAWMAYEEGPRPGGTPDSGQA